MATTTVFLYDPHTGINHDITAEVQSVEFSSGRNRELDEIAAGTCRVRFRNFSGNFNPYFLTESSFLLLESGDYLLLEQGGRLILEALGTGGDYGIMTLGRKLTVLDGSITVFTGFVEDFEYEWAHGNIAGGTIVCADGLARLARQKFLEWVTTPGETTGERVNSVITRPEVDDLWATALLFDTGLSTLAEDFVAFGTNVLDYLRKVTSAEQGRLYVSGFGVLVFQDRASVGTGTPVLDFISTADGQDAGEIPFSAIGVTFGSELLYNRVSVQNIDSDAQSVDDPIGRSNQGERHLPLSDMLLEDDIQAADLAQYLLNRYSSPEAVVSSIRVPLHRLSSANREAVANLQISETVSLDWTPTVGFGPVNETLVVEGRGYFSDMKSIAWMTFQLSAAPDNAFFILDSATDGVLDVSQVGF